MQRGIVDMQDDFLKESQSYFNLSLLLQVRRAVFANLLARLFVRKIEQGQRDKHPERSTSLGDIFLEDDPKVTDIDSFLIESLFQRYRVVFEADQYTEHPAAQQETDIAVFCRSDCPKVPGGLEKVWSAYLYRNK
jgi:hypothetical protein